MSRRANNVCIWVDKRSSLQLHEASLVMHGGLRGIRDENLLESALAQPQNLLAYKEDASLAELAANYSLGMARNRPFLDGNKRAAFMLLGLFLALNSYMLVAAQPDAFVAMLAVASGEMEEAELAAWIGANLQPM